MSPPGRAGMMVAALQAGAAEVVEVVLWAGGVVGAVTALVLGGRKAYWWALTPAARATAYGAMWANKWFHTRRAAAVRAGARMVCVEPGCKRVVSAEDAERDPWKCDPCTRKLVKRMAAERYAEVEGWWTSRGRCMKCGHEYDFTCPRCGAQGKLPVVP